jgi:hypothetical protein
VHQGHWRLPTARASSQRQHETLNFIILLPRYEGVNDD